MKINNEIINDSSLISNAFSLYFSQSPQVQLQHYHTNGSVSSQPCNSSFTFRPVSSADVLKVINKLYGSSGPGPDGIEGKFVKVAAQVIAFPLAKLFNMSFSTCEVPFAWKCAKVIPLHKGGDSQNINNYRPISIINTVVKIVEKIIFDQLSTYLQNNNLLSQCQSGFRKHFSTTTALLKFTNDIISGFDGNDFTGAIFFRSYQGI